MAYGQNVSLCHVLDFARTQRTGEVKGSFLHTVSEKGMPALGEHGPEAWFREIVETAADNVFPRQPEQPAGADAGIVVSAIVIRDQDRRERMEHHRAEQPLEFPGTMLLEPTRG